MKGTVLVTGGLGYLGGRICDHLRSCPGISVRPTSRRSGDRLPGWTQGLDIRPLDLGAATRRLPADLMAGVDTVVHLAALNAGQCAADPAAAIAVNIGGTQALVTAAAEAGVRRFIYMSTAHIYGAPLVGHITETQVPRPRHPYAWSHRSAEDIVLGARGLEGVVLRLSNAIGAPMDDGADCWMLAGPDLCRQASRSNRLVLTGDGSAQRDFIAMSDVVRVVEHTLGVPSAALADSLFNVGGGMVMRIRQLAERIAAIRERVTGRRPLVSAADSRPGQEAEPLFYDTEKFAGTGFVLHGDLDSELEETLRFCRLHDAGV